MKNGLRISLVLLFCLVLLPGPFVKQAKAATVSNESISVTVGFNVNGGDGSFSPVQLSYGSTYGDLPVATRTNYTFLGWYTFRSGGTKITSTTNIIKPLSHTLYAHWRGILKEITLDANGGSLEETTAKVYYGSKYVYQLPIPTMDSYVFAGWYTASSEGDKITEKSIFTEDSATTLYAQWIEKTVKVIFITFNGEKYEQTASYGQPYGELPEPVREGYTFGGWYKYRDYKNYKASAITAETIVTNPGQVKLYARWYSAGTE